MPPWLLSAWRMSVSSIKSLGVVIVDSSNFMMANIESSICFDLFIFFLIFFALLDVDDFYNDFHFYSLIVGKEFRLNGDIPVFEKILNVLVCLSIVN